jgi:PAS domain S-box-containing protein
MISVLLVDDEPGLLTIGKMFLEKSGNFTVTTSLSAPEAIRLLEQEQFDAIISGYQMPEMNGIEFLKILRRNDNSIPFIIITGKGREEIAIEALNAGADFYLQKGVDPEAQFAGLSHIIRKVVGQHRAEEELGKSEEQYRRICEGLTDYLYTVRVEDGRAVTTTHSAACLVVTGYTAEEFAADPYLWIRMVSDDDRDRVISHFSGVLSGKQVPPVDHRIVRKDGQVRWVRDTPILQFDPAGRLISYDGVVKDITGPKVEEEKLSRLTEFQESVITNARVWLSVLMQSGTILLWNTAAEEISGYRAEEVIGQKEIWKKLYPDKEYRKQVTDTITRIIRDKNYLENFETTIISKQGIKKVISWNTKGIPGATGAVSDYIAIGVDVTDRKMAEDALRVHAEIERNMSEAVYLIRVSDGMIVHTNPIFEHLFGYGPGELVGRHVSVLNAPVDKDPKEIADGIISSLMRTGGWSGEVLSIRKDGTTFWSQANVFTFLHPRYGQVWLSMHQDITGRKVAEVELRNTERRLGDIINFLPDATFAIDREGKVIAWNRAIEEMTGIRAEDMLGKGDYEYALPFYGERRPILIDLAMMQDPGVLKHYTSVRRDGDALTAETTLAHLGGKNLYLWGKSILFKNDQGDIVGAIESIRDITDRRTAEELLRESRETYRELVESISDVIFEIDSGGKITYISPVVHKVLEFEPREMIGKNFIEFVYPEDRELLIKRFSELSEAIEHPLDYRVMTKPGGVRWVRTQTKSVMKGKEFTGARGTLVDITKRKVAEQALKMSQVQLAEAMDLAHMANWEFDVDTGIFTFDDRFFALYGTSVKFEGGNRMPSEVYARKFVHPDDLYMVADEVKKAIQATDPGYVSQVEHRIIRSDGEVRHIVVRIGITKDENGRTIKTHGANQDITERIRAEEAIQQANKKLTLLSSITRHDINNQLTILMGYLTILEKQQPDTSFSDYFLRVSNAAKRISAMIQFTKEYEQIGVHAPIWQECRTLVDTAAKQAPLGMVMVENDLPADMTVFADQLITKVFYNLMDNAGRYGGKITTIRFSALKSGDDHLIVCEDDGDGIPAEEKEKVFERGFGKNTGMGLALAREILSISGITITETGEPGKGARFEMMVPKGMWRTAGYGA